MSYLFTVSLTGFHDAEEIILSLVGKLKGGKYNKLIKHFAYICYTENFCYEVFCVVVFIKLVSFKLIVPYILIVSHINYLI